MDKLPAAIIVVAIILVLFGLMWLSWWGRKKAQSGIPALEPVPAELGAQLGTFEGLYLATTPGGDPLNRIAVRGLGFRARTTLEVSEAGFVFIGDRFIPANAVSDVRRASWTIDRGVEPGGLSVVEWRLGDLELDSYFRLDDPEGFIAATTSFMKKAEK